MNNWTYAHSAALGMQYAYRQTPDGPEVMTADKIRYTPEEVKHLDGAGGIRLSVHLVKRVFRGEVVGVDAGSWETFS